MNIEEAIEILRNSKQLYLKEKIDSDILEKAIETLLTAYEELRKKNEPQSDCEEPTERTEEMVNIKWINYNYISKDEIRHIRDKAECMDYYSLNDVIDDLTKLIGE